MKAIPDCVVDASAAMPLFLPESLSDHATRFFLARDRQPDLRFHVPDLFFAECANVLWKTARRLGTPGAEVEADLEELLAMDFVRLPVAALVQEGLRIALAHAVSVYDACTVAAAARLGMPLVTADERLVRKLAGAAFDVRWLKDIAA